MLPPRREENWKAIVNGTLGSFRTSKDLYVEFIQTTLDVNSLAKVDPVRRFFKRNELKFELLLQRDLDDDRINDDLLPYLKEEQRVRFFPSISIVIIGKNREKRGILEKYPKMEASLTPGTDETKNWSRRFGGLFEVSAYVKGSVKAADKVDADHIFTSPVSLRVSDEATLLAIDGQHRLVALQALVGKLPEEERMLYRGVEDDHTEKFDKLQVPATIMFVPALHAGNRHTDHLTLVEAFRQIFVDINRNARQVNESRNILLDEHDLASIFTRNICSHVQETAGDNGLITLDCIEWDRVEKENQLTRPASATNVIFICDVLRDWLGDGDPEKDTGDKLRNHLKLDKIKRKLGSKSDYEKITVKRFTFEQKTAIMQHFRERYLEALVTVLSSMPCIKSRVEEVGKIRAELTRSSGSAEELGSCQKTLEVLFGGPEKQIHLNDPKIKGAYANLSNRLQEFDEVNGLSVVRTKMFQKAYFKAVFELFADDKVTKDVGFAEFASLLSDSIDERVNDRWRRALGRDSAVLEYGIGSYGIANWKVDFCRDLFVLATLRPDAAFVKAVRQEVIKQKIREIRQRLQERLEQNLKEQVDEEELTPGKMKRLLEKGKKELSTLSAI
jgi:hypothetical protein